MKALKKILFVIAAIITIVLVTALFMKKEFKVERSIRIQAPSTEVFDYIHYVENQNNFAVWQAQDPNIKQWSKGNDGTVGYIAYWESKKKEVGNGEQEIIEIQDGKMLKTALRFTKPEQMEATAMIITENVQENETKVSWSVSGKIPYPFNIMMPFIDFEGTMGPDLEKGLSNLKQILEAQE